MANKLGSYCTGCVLDGNKSQGFIQITAPKDYSKIKLLVQGDLPTQDDLDAGQPFAGKIGHWLKWNWLGSVGLKEDEVLFDTTIRCRPLNKKRVGSPYPIDTKKSSIRTEAESCCNQYSIWDSLPTHIPLLLVGNEAAFNQAQIDSAASWHGHIFKNSKGRIVGVTYHPASVMKNPNLLPLVVKDTQNLLDAARNPKILERPKVDKGIAPYRKEEVVADLEWEYDHKTGKSGAVTVVGVSYDGGIGNSTFNVESGMGVIRKHFSEGNRVIGHNFIAADLLHIDGLPKSFGPDHIIDTQIVGHLIHKHWAELGLYGLGDLVKYYLPTTDWKRDKGDALAYNGRDVAYNYKLWEAMQIDLTLTGQWHLVEQQQRLARMTSLMKQRGIRIDSKAIRIFNKKWNEDRGTIKESLPFNPNSPKQVIQWFKDRKITIKGSDYDTLAKFRGKFPEIDAVLDFKDQGKGLGSWYDDEAIELGRIFSEHKVTGTAVERFSSAGPNVQNIPPWAKFAILPQNDDEYLFNTDAKNLEGRTVAFHAKDKQMLEDFASGMDIHSIVASRVFNLPLESIGRKSDERQVGKTVVHASNYVEGPHNLSNRLYGNVKHDSIRKAETVQRAYFKVYKRTGEWHKEVANQLDRGDIMLSNAYGSKRFIYAQNSHERVKRGTHFLGCSSGAHLVNKKALEVWTETGILPMLIVHDSHCYSLPKGEAGLKLEKQITEIQNRPEPEFERLVEFPWEAERGKNYKEMTSAE